MAVAAEHLFTEDEYLELERAAPCKSEYYQGRIFAMAGASAAHNDVSINVLVITKGQLRGSGCKPYGSDMRVRVSATRLNTYPDVSIVCGTPEFRDEKRDTLLNPTVIVEVLSPSTERYDRGTKFENYQKLDSLEEYLLVSQAYPRIDRYRRNPDGTWLLIVAEGMDAIVQLESIPCELRLAEVYEEVEFPPAPIRMGSAGSVQDEAQ